MTYRENDKPEEKPVLIKRGPNFEEMWWEVKCTGCESVYKYQFSHLIEVKADFTKSYFTKCPVCTKYYKHERNENRSTPPTPEEMIDHE